jgi:RNA polymerase sigma-70 factor (ECF subfamily)
LVSARGDFARSRGDKTDPGTIERELNSEREMRQMSIPLISDVVAPEPLLEAVRTDSVSPPARDMLRLLYRQMRVLAGPRPDLDDLVQCAAERMLRALPRFEGRSALSTFSYGIAYRTLLGHDRWFRRWSRRFAFADDEQGPEPSNGSENSEEATLRAQRSASLHRALAQLSPCKRAVIVLHDLEGMSMKDVATIVEANERTVRSRLRDGRKKLAEILLADPRFDGEER